MSSFHDEVFSELNSARKLVAEFKRRPHGGMDAAPAMDVPDEAAPMERSEKAAGPDVPAESHTENRLEAAEVLRELADARAKERAAAEESIRKAREVEQSASGSDRVQRATAPADPIRYFWFPGIGAGHVWYFTAGRERCGPVTFKDLRKMAASHVLDPRLDMVWKKGMPEWQPAGLVDGLYERSSIQAEAVRAPVPRTAPVKSLRSSALMEKLASKDLHWPGIGRLALLLGILPFPVLWNYLQSFAGPFLTSMLDAHLMEMLNAFLTIVPPLVIVALILSRLANVGMNRWWSLAIMVPLLNLWIAFRCLFCPAGYAHHRKMDRNGLAMITAFFLLAPFAWQSMLKHPVAAYSAYLQSGIRTVIEGAGKTGSPSK